MLDSKREWSCCGRGQLRSPFPLSCRLTDFGPQASTATLEEVNWYESTVLSMLDFLSPVDRIASGLVTFAVIAVLSSSVNGKSENQIRRSVKN